MSLHLVVLLSTDGNRFCLPRAKRKSEKTLSHSDSEKSWNLELKEVEFTEEAEETASVQGRKPTTNAAHIWLKLWNSDPGYIFRKRVPYRCTISAHGVSKL